MNKPKKNRSKRAKQAVTKTQKHKYCLLKEQKMATKRRRKAWKKLKRVVAKIMDILDSADKVITVINIIIFLIQIL